MQVHVQGLGAVYPGHGFKIQQLLEYVRTIPEEDHILFTDAYDVVFLEPARSLINTFEQFCAPIVMNSELAIAPDDSLLTVLPIPPADHALPHMNCGAFMGQVRHVKAMMNGIRADIAANFGVDTQVSSRDDWMAVNDQRWFWRYYLMN